MAGAAAAAAQLRKEREKAKQSQNSQSQPQPNPPDFYTPARLPELKTEEGYSADIVRTLCRHCADIVPKLCGHISPGMYVRTISFFGFQLRAAKNYGRSDRHLAKKMDSTSCTGGGLFFRLHEYFSKTQYLFDVYLLYNTIGVNSGRKDSWREGKGRLYRECSANCET